MLTEQETLTSVIMGQPEAFPEGIGHADGKPGRGKRKAVVRKPDQREHGYKPALGPRSQPSCWDIFITEVPPTSKRMAQNKKNQCFTCDTEDIKNSVVLRRIHANRARQRPNSKKKEQRRAEGDLEQADPSPFG